MGVMVYVFMTLALYHSTVISPVIVGSQLAIPFGILASAIMIGENISRNKWILIFTAFIGIVIIFFDPKLGNNFLGLFFASLMALFFGLSQVYSRQLKDFGQGVGFNTSSRKNNTDDHSKSIIKKALSKSFAPEFLNRIDDVIIFNSLNKEHINKIIDIEMEDILKRIMEIGYSVKISGKAKDFIADKGFDKNFGARPLKRAIQKYFEDPLAEEIIHSNIMEGDNIKVDLNKEGDKLVMKLVKQRKKPSNKKKQKTD